ncbi:MAG: hypothetical protein QOG64_3150 [Acidimicrobiaceae bacterium]|nr:hypothetical protein [Acidimicrobiaceae bacterium]
MVWALLGTVVAAAFVIGAVRANGGNILDLIQPGAQGPARGVIQRDFPTSPLPPGLGHDGQQFYAIARQPMHPRAAAGDLDRPRYRLQRPLYPWLAWALHPSGGGIGLIRAMLLIGLLATFGGGLATGALATTLGGPSWLAALFPLLPGTYVSLRISTADALAAGLTAAALALSLRRRSWAAVAVAVGAVLTKEVMLLVFLIWAVTRRDRGSRIMAGTGILALGGLALALRVILPGRGTGVVDVTVPGRGLLDAARHWSGGHDLGAAAFVLVSLVLAAAALARQRLRTPIGWLIAGQLALLVLLRSDAHQLWLNGTRVELPLVLFSLIGLTCPASAGIWTPTGVGDRPGSPYGATTSTE